MVRRVGARPMLVPWGSGRGSPTKSQSSRTRPRSGPRRRPLGGARYGQGGCEGCGAQRRQDARLRRQEARRGPLREREREDDDAPSSSSERSPPRRPNPFAKLKAEEAARRRRQGARQARKEEDAAAKARDDARAKTEREVDDELAALKKKSAASSKGGRRRLSDKAGPRVARRARRAPTTRRSPLPGAAPWDRPSSSGPIEGGSASLGQDVRRRERARGPRAGARSSTRSRARPRQPSAAARPQVDVDMRGRPVLVPRSAERRANRALFSAEQAEAKGEAVE